MVRRGSGWKRPSLPAVTKLPRLERSLQAGNVQIFGGHPIPCANRVFCFWVGLTMSLFDEFGRQITDLRISITDRCNFRCVYCRSADPENYRDHDEILSWPELDRLAHIFLSLGIRKIRITGGEPLVREGVEDYIARLHALGVEDLSMTTNGHLLAERCDRLLAAGLRRINISLDSLDPGKFERITRTKSFSTVMHGIEVAQKSGLAP